MKCNNKQFKKEMYDCFLLVLQTVKQNVTWLIVLRSSINAYYLGAPLGGDNATFPPASCQPANGYCASSKGLSVSKSISTVLLCRMGK